MKAATVRELKIELKSKSPEELLDICLHLSKFKKENKELLTYLLYERDNEEEYIESIKGEIDEGFEEIKNKSYYFLAKGARKILRLTKKYIRYSKKKETEIELLMHYSMRLKKISRPIAHNMTLINLLDRQLEQIRKAIKTLHEDLQYDYSKELEDKMKNN